MKRVCDYIAPCYDRARLAKEAHELEDAFLVSLGYMR
jgi:hypothetical protein